MQYERSDNMLMPDVTAILDDPEVGGGVSFQVKRCQTVRSSPIEYTKNEVIYNVTGNIQPQDMSNQSSTAEDLLTEVIIAYSRFTFQVGSNSITQIIEADIILYDNKQYRVTRVDDWSKWGYTRAVATRIMDVEQSSSNGE